MEIHAGDMIRTPRFCTVRIEAVFDSVDRMNSEGFTETTHYQSNEYVVCGKSIGVNQMVFAAAKRE